MRMSTKCQKKKEKKMTINVIQHDDRLFYNGTFSIASKNDLDDQNLLLATVPIIIIHEIISSNYARGFFVQDKISFFKL
jgi:hypothetical protein